MPVNRLANEQSPYLLQHAHNPVDWYPWGPEAFEKARGEDKPVFLSIGYSTCHWCHVMEHESFENEDIAATLNRSFVPIKVDREERPDIDRIYMTFVQTTTGGGGWPMSVFLTPDLKPFYGGTYFPPDNRYGRPGFKALLEQLAHLWISDRARILESTDQVMAELQRVTSAGTEPASILDKSVVDAGFYPFRRSYDSAHGGFGGAPKFPRPAVLNFLFRYAAATGNPEAQEMALHTLRNMAEGGVCDLLGGGFHRYAVDEIWFVPHFEKMLYDQAQLAVSYLEAYQLTKDSFFAAVARDIFGYVRRDMTAPEGGFYSAEDADSSLPEDPAKKGEGAFYVWTRQEITEALGNPDAGIFGARFGAAAEGNVRNDPHGEFTGKNILSIAHTIADAAKTVELPPDMIREKLANACRKLLAIRSQRPRPHLDDKVLTAWNGLMISAFARGAQILDDPAYAEAAGKAAAFISSRMWNDHDGTLLRRFRAGDAAIPGFLDDYAFFAQALLDLYETDFEFGWLEAAIAITERMLERFEDREHGAFFATTAESRDLVLRIKDDYDGAEPSGNSIAILNLLRLARVTGRQDFRDAAERGLKALSTRLTAQPISVPQLLVALMYSQAHPRQIILAGDRASESTRMFLRRLHERFLPNSVVVLLDSDETRARFEKFNPAVADMRHENGRTRAYVCRDYACELPTDDVEKFAGMLN